MDLSEKETRESHIDPSLKDAGWKDEYVKREVNSVKSNFKTKQFKFMGDGVERGEDRFIDYLLLSENHVPLAIIEAKRFSLDPEKGTIQATTYQKDIEKQIGYAPVVFLTNGKKWYIKEKGAPMREVAEPLSQRDLQRKISLAQSRKDLSIIEVNTSIVDRSRSLQIVKQILDHFNSGKRSALIAMATGTGKTRVSMGLIYSLIKSGWIQNVLFIVDRRSLGRQAYGDIQEFLSSEPSQLINEQGFTKDKRLYVSTVQTLSENHTFQKFGAGFFDLIIYDEAHRSYYDNNNKIMKYFDALKIGLTATPSKKEDKDTFDLFECERGVPTAEYSYDEAVSDDVLVPYDAQLIETKVLSMGIKGLDLNKDLKQELKEQEEDPEKLELPGKKFVKYFTDQKTNELIVQEFMHRCYKTDDGKPCKSIFFCMNVLHAQALEKTFRTLYPNLIDDVKVIVSNYDRYMDEVERFKKESSPRVAISVGVLDTGINIPEIMNLVFVTPVFSYIRFWQMLGRGTRNRASCKKLNWLPADGGFHDKRDFRILDFAFGDYSNIKEHQLEHVDTKRASEDIRVKIFSKELELLKKKLTEHEKAIVETHLIDRIKAIDQRSYLVKQHIPMIKKVISKQYSITEHIAEVKSELAHLMQLTEYGDGKVQTCISHCVDLFSYVKEGDQDAIAKVQEFVTERLISIWERDLESVKRKDPLIKQVLQEKFWLELDFDDIDMLIKEIAPLMKYYELTKKRILRVNAADFVQNVETFKMQPKENKALTALKNSSLIQKMLKEGVTWRELKEIEQQLIKLNPQWTIENVQKHQDFIIFLRAVLELQDLPDPEQMIKDQFDHIILTNNKEYNARQIAFLRLLASFFVQAKRLERKDFTLFPLADERPLDKFSPAQLDTIIKYVEKIKIR